MAKKNEEPTTAESIRSSGQSIFKIIIFVGPIVVLGYVLWMLFVGSDPRRQLETPEETLTAYSQVVEPFVGDTPVTPDFSIVRDTMGFFDDESRQFFQENARTMARFRLQFEPDTFKDLNRQEIEARALLYLLSKPPLNGIAGVQAQRNINDDRVEITVMARTLEVKTFEMIREGGIWLITDLAGVREEIAAELENFEKFSPEAATPDPI